MQDSIYLYTLSTCSHCKALKKYLDDHGIEYDFVDVDQTTGKTRENLVEEIKQYNPKLTFPTILLKDKVIVGFRENEVKEALGL